MNKIVRKVRARRDYLALQRAIDNANTPSMRNEIIMASQRQWPN